MVVEDVGLGGQRAVQIGGGRVGGVRVGERRVARIEQGGELAGAVVARGPRPPLDRALVDVQLAAREHEGGAGAVGHVVGAFEAAGRVDGRCLLAEGAGLAGQREVGAGVDPLAVVGAGPARGRVVPREHLVGGAPFVGQLLEADGPVREHGGRDGGRLPLVDVGGGVVVDQRGLAGQRRGDVGRQRVALVVRVAHHRLAVEGLQDREEGRRHVVGQARVALGPGVVAVVVQVGGVGLSRQRGLDPGGQGVAVVVQVGGVGFARQRGLDLGGQGIAIVVKVVGEGVAPVEGRLQFVVGVEARVRRPGGHHGLVEAERAVDELQAEPRADHRVEVVGAAPAARGLGPLGDLAVAAGAVAEVDQREAAVAHHGAADGRGLLLVDVGRVVRVPRVGLGLQGRGELVVEHDRAGELARRDLAQQHVEAVHVTGRREVGAGEAGEPLGLGGPERERHAGHAQARAQLVVGADPHAHVERGRLEDGAGQRVGLVGAQEHVEATLRDEDRAELGPQHVGRGERVGVVVEGQRERDLAGVGARVAGQVAAEVQHLGRRGAERGRERQQRREGQEPAGPQANGAGGREGARGLHGSNPIVRFQVALDIGCPSIQGVETPRSS